MFILRHLLPLSRLLPKIHLLRILVAQLVVPVSLLPTRNLFMEPREPRKTWKMPRYVVKVLASNLGSSFRRLHHATQSITICRHRPASLLLRRLPCQKSLEYKLPQSFSSCLCLPSQLFNKSKRNMVLFWRCARRQLVRDGSSTAVSREITSQLDCRLLWDMTQQQSNY